MPVNRRFAGMRYGQTEGEDRTSLSRKLTAEFIGTFWLVFGGCGSAVLAAGFSKVGIGLLGVALTFGLTVLTMAYAIGHISGCHLNPAVSVGLMLWMEGTMRRKNAMRLALLGFGLSGMVTAVAPARAEGPRAAGSDPEEVGVLRAACESLTGDVYAEPSRWRPLSLGTFFSEGWNQPWASPSAGGGGAPRQGWINAADGVFYRLAIATFGYKHATSGNGDAYNGGATLYAPFSRRFELQFDLPFVASAQGIGGSPSHTGFGDFQITPRVMLSESRDVTQSFNLTFRTPTGDTNTGNELAAVTPNYQFWANWWRGLVVRGSLGMSVPYHNVNEVGARTSFLGNVAAGYYFTEHDRAPFGDLVGYVATNLTQATDDRGPATTGLTFTPGFRTHLGRNWYLLGGVEVPVTNPKSYDYSILGGLMFVF